MITKTCECGVVFEYEPVQGYPDKRKYCDPCRNRKKAEWDAKSNPVPTAQQHKAQEVPANSKTIEPESGLFQSTVWNHDVEANVYKIGLMGKAGFPFWEHRIKYETIPELKAKMQELRDAGLMDLPLNELPRD